MYIFQILSSTVYAPSKNVTSHLSKEHSYKDNAGVRQVEQVGVGSSDVLDGGNEFPACL